MGKLSDETRRALEPYRALIAEFTSGDISADQFETRYLAQYKAEPKRWPPDIFDILDRLFFCVDDYVGDDELRARAGGLDGSELGECAQATLQRLDLYLP